MRDRRLPAVLFSLPGWLWLAAAATAQVIPAAAVGTEQAPSSAFPWGLGESGCRAQFAFAAANWTAPFDLRALKFRADGGLTAAGGCFHNVEVYASTMNGALSPTFASNGAAVPMQVYAGDVMVAPVAAATPNTWYVSIPTRPFRYTPTAGTSLLIEIRFPTGSLHGESCAGDAVAAGPVGSSVVSPSDLGAIGAPGTLPVVEFVTDPVSPILARAERFGSGCSNRPSGLHELFDASNPFDLAGTPSAPTSLHFLPTGPGWATVPNSPAWSVPSGGALVLNLGDDDVSAPLVLPFQFPLPGLLCPSGGCQNFPQATMAIRVGSNGEIWFTDQTDTDYTPSYDEFARGGPRLDALWTDLDPTSGGTITFEIDSSLTEVVVTWAGVPQYGAPGNTNHAQAVLHSTGAIELRWQTVATTLPILVGLTMGGGVGDHWSWDLSSAPSWSLAGVQPLDLSSTTLPVVGTVANIQLCGLPWDSPMVGLLAGSLTELAPGLPMLGLDGCHQYIGGTIVTLAFFVPATCCYWFGLAIPNNANLIGIDVYLQGGAVNLMPWSFAATSNGLDLRIG